MTAQAIDRNAHGYERAADAYERGRPEYPAPAVAHVIRELDLRPGRTVLDLAAGTGKFTRQLAPTGARLVAVEPVAEMRAKLSANLPAIAVLEGTAEAIPLPDASVDAVTVAQAFHWFRGTEALAEIGRVVRPGGGLALVWNVRDESVDWVARLTDLLNVHSGDTPRHRTGLWRTPFEQTRAFSPLQSAHFPFAFDGTLEQVVDRAGSTSFVAALDDAARERFLDAVRTMLRTHPLTRDRDRIAFPYVTDVHTCRRI